MDINSCTFVGRVSDDPKYTAGIKTSKGTTSRLAFTLAVNRMRKENGADFIRCVSWGKRAEADRKVLYKGKEVGIAGRLSINNTQNEDGSWNNYTNVIVERAHYGVDSKKHVEEHGMGTAGQDDLDAIADRLATEAKKPAVTKLSLADRLMKKGMSEEDALKAAEKYLAAQGQSEDPAPKTAEEGADSADIPF